MHQRALKHFFIAAIVLLAANIVITIALIPPSSSAQVPVHGRTMYKVTHVHCNEQEIQTVVDIFSRDGWELVTHYNEILIFKKQ
ncbi:MAG TPA: hypothetical protein VL126_07145 [Bacteroidota bacterium]|nr:hypothetical protein [Bacteroidota bacterium]